ncbi:MAG: hypothetical protein R2691_05205 [Solirubrobacterales bacterium]
MLVLVRVVLLEVAARVSGVDRVPAIALGFRKEQQDVVDWPISTRAAVGVSPTPNDLVSKLPGAKDLVEDHAQVVTRCRVAVEVEGTALVEHPVKLEEARRHRDQVSREVAPAQGANKRLNKVRKRARHERRQLAEVALCVGRPTPLILERLCPPVGRLAISFGVNQVVGATRVERRV